MIILKNMKRKMCGYMLSHSCYKSCSRLTIQTSPKQLSRVRPKSCCQQTRARVGILGINVIFLLKSNILILLSPTLF